LGKCSSTRAIDHSPFRHVADAQARDAIGRTPRNRHAVEDDIAAARTRQTEDATQRRGLTGTVESEQRHQFAFVYVKSDIVQDVTLAVKRVEVFDR
jgi:hypothetical protein